MGRGQCPRQKLNKNCIFIEQLKGAKNFLKFFKNAGIQVRLPMLEFACWKRCFPKGTRGMINIAKILFDMGCDFS